MRHIGTYNTAAEAGAALIAGQFHGLFTNDTNADSTMRDILIDHAEAAEAGDNDRMEELQIEALGEVAGRIVIISEDSGEVINPDHLMRYLDGALTFEMWSTAPRARHFLTYDHIDIPAEGWRAITPRHRNAALDWCDDIHGQDGALRLAALFAQLEEAK